MTRVAALMSPPTLPVPATRAPLLVPLLLCAAILGAWANTLRGPFVFDDIPSIVENASIRQLGSLAWLNPPHAWGETVGGRPVLNFTFALNYAVSGVNVWSYHVLNLLIHTAAALLLWRVLGRLPPVGERVAAASALLWAVHPLQTASVTYVVQRAESLAGLFVLLTLYAFLRYATDQTRRARWAVLSVVACLAGVGTKETAAAAPLLALLLGTMFFAPDLAEAWRRFGRLFVALFATWIVLAALVWQTHGRGSSAGMDSSVDVLGYALTQAWAIPHYLRLAICPVGLTFDYGMAVADGIVAVALPGLWLIATGAATVWALGRRHPAGVAGAAFFLLLAPSSSFVPVATQTIAEHRMYLALAAPVVLICAGVARARERWHVPRVLAPLLVAAVAVGLAAATFARNADYGSARALWADTVAQRPENPRARYNLGLALLADGRRVEATRQFSQAIRLQPTHAFAHFQLGGLAMTDGAWATAATHFTAAVQADPHYVDAHVNLGHVLAREGRTQEAIEHYRAALADEPAAETRTSLAALLTQLGRLDEAVPLLQQAIESSPELPEAHYQWARLCERAGAAKEAEAALHTALRLRPDFAAAALALGNLLGRQGRFAEAIKAFQSALEATPADHQARNNLANCFLAVGRFPEAIAEYERILHARPNDATVRQNLEIARAMQAQR